VEVGAGNVGAGAQEVKTNVRIMKPVKQLIEAFMASFPDYKTCAPRVSIERGRLYLIVNSAI
jgi:hypothetical protein